MTDQYTGRILDEIEADSSYPIPQPLAAWITTGLLDEKYEPIPNPYMPPLVWTDVVGLNIDQFTQAWVQRHGVLTRAKPFRGSRESAELDAMNTMRALQRLSVERTADVKRLTQQRNTLEYAVIKLAETMKDYAVEEDLCSDYEGTVESFLSMIDDSLRDKIGQALSRNKSGTITRIRNVTVRIRETLPDVQVPFTFDADTEAEGIIPVGWEEISFLTQLRDVVEVHDDPDSDVEYEFEDE